MSEILIFLAGVITGLAAFTPARNWLLAKLKKDEPQPVMGGPIQPGDAESKDEK